MHVVNRITLLYSLATVVWAHVLKDVGDVMEEET